MPGHPPGGRGHRGSQATMVSVHGALRLERGSVELVGIGCGQCSVWEDGGHCRSLLVSVCVARRGWRRAAWSRGEPATAEERWRPRLPAAGPGIGRLEVPLGGPCVTAQPVLEIPGTRPRPRAASRCGEASESDPSALLGCSPQRLQPSSPDCAAITCKVRHIPGPAWGSLRESVQ